MIKPDEATIIEPLTSCTVDVAIAKLLGWMQGDIRHQYIPLELDGVSEEALKHMHSFEVSIWRFLTEQREAAQWVYKKAVEDKETKRRTNQKKQKIARVEEIVTRAKSYQRDIDDELRKGRESVLEVDKSASDSSGLIHIVLASLDKWALEKYGISVLDFSKSKVLTVDEPEYPADVRTDKGGLTKTSTNSLFLTFGILINAFVESNPDLSKDESKPIVSVLAEYLSERAKEPGKRKPIYGQSAERITDRIEDAMKAYSLAMGIKDKPVA